MKTELKELHIEINHKCNLACLMCNHRFDDNQNAQINKEDFSRLISSGALKNLELLSISGGEPTLNEDFDFILKNAVKTLKDAQILILSNLIDSDKLFKALENLKPEQLSKIHIGSSLDGPREIHNKIRRNDEAFDKLMSNEQVALDIEPCDPDCGVMGTLGWYMYDYLGIGESDCCDPNKEEIETNIA